MMITADITKIQIVIPPQTAMEGPLPGGTFVGVTSEWWW